MSISVTYGNHIKTFTIPSESPKVIVLNYDDTKTHYNIMSDNPFYGRENRGYLSCIHDGIRCKKNRVIYSTCVILIRGVITAVDLEEGSQSQGISSLDILIPLPFINFIDVFA